MNTDYETVVGKYRGLIHEHATVYSDADCASLITMLFNQDPSCVFRAKAAMELLSSGVFDTVPEKGPIGIDGMPKTLSLLWRRLLHSVQYPGVPTAERMDCAKFVGSGTSRELTKKEEAAVRSALREEFDREQYGSEILQDACSLILAHATAPEGRDYVVRGVAATFAHRASIEVLKVAASAVTGTARIPRGVLAASAERVRTAAHESYRLTLTIDQLNAYLRKEVTMGPGGCSFVEATGFLDNDSVIHFTYTVDAESVLGLRPTKEDVVNLCKDWLEGVRRKVQFFRQEKWNTGGKFPVVTFFLRTADYGGHGKLAELTVE